ncbi:MULTISPECIES: amino acid adenylation domain-containing protein [Streptacidiphilus]|uniref:Amino acid adenylation domain-containing protein n=1 Tax=Streptacidiphilus cavernicola TaxID=3342716 RepID=A0ABV6UGY2_9ACTN|nr:amino acid adenylation domain-containing protein [Streptacidiphilus jeojiense]
MDFPSDLQGRTSSGGPALRALPAPDPRLRSEVLTRCAKLGTGPDALLLAAYALTLARWTGTAVVPVRCADRTAVVEVDDGSSTDELIRAVEQQLHGSTAVSGPVQAGFGPDAVLGEGVEVVLRADWSADRPGDGWAGSTGCLAGVWTPAELAAFSADLLAAVAELAAASGPVEDVRCIAPERRALLRRINGTDRDFPTASLEELFHRTARRFPDAVAVRDGDVELTYRQLVAAAGKQARLLVEAGVAPGDTVLIGLPRSAAEIVAVLGTVQAGAAYVGVDLGSPPAHLARIVAKCRPAAVLHSPEDGTAPPAGVRSVPVWNPSWNDESDPDPGSITLLPGGAGERLAYVAFTSGSTGEPKGVCVPHLGVVRLVHGADYARLGPGERVLRLSPLAFDASTLELWGALLTGAALEVYTEPLPSPTELGEFLVERGVTVAWFTAGLFRLLAEFAPDSLHGLRQVLTGGDVVPHEHVARLLERHPGLVVTNGYGPTENTTFTTTHSVARPEDVDGPLPIGSPIPGTRVHVLDGRGRLLPPGAVGELYTSGAGLATGYLGDEDETARRFGCFSTDLTAERLYRTGDLVRYDGLGRLRFLGRADDQVKLRGYRVEPAAIAAVIARLPGVQDALVFAIGADSATKRLVAAVVPAAGGAPAPVGLRQALEQQLPSYMVPALWTVVDELPLTRNGKVDRKALAASARPAR